MQCTTTQSMKRKQTKMEKKETNRFTDWHWSIGAFAIAIAIDSFLKMFNSGYP